MTTGVFEWLADGRWTLERQFNNSKMPGLTGSGQAWFSPVAKATLAYEESGLLSTGGVFSKKYQFAADRDVILVTHADPHNKGQSFQTLALQPDEKGTWSARACNQCALDAYKSHWQFAKTWWRMHHVVSGPRKNYEIVTLFRRP